MTNELIKRLQRIRKCIYIAVEKPVADDIADAIKQAIDAILHLQTDCNDLYEFDRKNYIAMRQRAEAAEATVERVKDLGTRYLTIGDNYTAIQYEDAAREIQQAVKGDA